MPTKTTASSKSRTKPQRRAPAKKPAVQPAAPKPEASAMFDTAAAETPPPADPAVPSEPSATTGQEPAATEPAAAPVDLASSDGPIDVRLGQVDGLLHRVPMADVQALFADSEDRIEAMRHAPSIAALQERMLGNEGRCAPVICLENDEGENLGAIAGLESIAAARNLGLDHVFVLTINVADAGAAQHHVAGHAQGRPLSSKTDCYTVAR